MGQWGLDIESVWPWVPESVGLCLCQPTMTRGDVALPDRQVIVAQAGYPKAHKAVSGSDKNGILLCSLQPLKKL